MRSFRRVSIWQLVRLAVVLLIVKIGVGIVLKYRDYLPPNFESDFLAGREDNFWGAYAAAFYVHIASGPSALLLGLLLMNTSFRQRFPQWHRRLGQLQILCVVCLLAPSGLWMARDAATGIVAGLGFGSLAMVTGTCAAWGWRAAWQRDFAAHRIWMQRTFVLLCSAVVVRVIGGLAFVTQVEADWLYPVTAWGCWLLPLMILEMQRTLTAGMGLAIAKERLPPQERAPASHSKRLVTRDTLHYSPTRERLHGGDVRSCYCDVRD